MKNLIIFLSVLFTIPLSAQDKYASVAGSGLGDGSSQTNEWTLTQAFSNAVAGQTVHVRKGDYGELRLTLANSGTASNLIRFVGYNTMPNDITTVDGDGSFFSYPSLGLDGENVPFLYETPPSDGRNVGTAIDLGGNDYVHFENFYIEGYNYGLKTGSSTIGISLKNIVTRNQGNYNAADLAADPFGSSSTGGYNGYGIVAQGDNLSIINCTSVNGAAQGITIASSDQPYLNGNFVYADNDVNPVDYYLLIGSNVTNGTILNTKIIRASALAHAGHGICFKAVENTTGNVVEGFTITNTNLEAQFPGVYGNTFKTGRIYDYLGENADYGGINLANGSHDNHFEDIYSLGRGIYFRDWNDGLSGDVNESSYNNTFNNIAIEDAVWAINFHHFSVSPTTLTTAPADDNTFYNCTFKNPSFMFQVSRPADNLQFINCVMTSANVYKAERNSAWPAQVIDDIYLNSTHFDHAYSNPTGINMQDVDPQFQTGVDELGLIATNALLLSGGIETPYKANNTLIGVYEFGTATTPSEVPSETIISTTRENATRRYYYNRTTN